MAKSYPKESHIRSILKGITWRIVATFDTFIVAYLVTWWVQGEPSWKIGLTIAGFEFFIKLAIYYFHERSWQFIRKDNQVTNREILYKTISWRIVATVMTFVISGSVLGAFGGVALTIALVELVTKFLLYYFHELAWLKIPLYRVRRFFNNLMKKSGTKKHPSDI